MSIFTKISDATRNITNIDAHIDTDAADRNIRNNIIFKGPNAWILAIAIVIASIGLNVNSTPVIIGAMLISPLMGPIFGLGLGMGINDMNLMKQAGKNLFTMVSISLGVSLLYFMVTPLNLTDQSELIARTRPTIFDVMIALFGGLAGIFEQSRKEKGTVFSGVAIATALMPPLCTAGYGLATGQMDFFLGALYLFSINCIFIALATYILVRYFHFKKAATVETKSGRRTQRLIGLILAVFLVPSVWTAVNLIKENKFEQNAALFVKEYNSFGNAFIYKHEIDHKNGSVLKLYFTGESLTETDRNNLYESAKEYGIGHDQLLIKENAAAIAMDANEIFKSLNSDIEKLESDLAKRDEIIKQHEATIKQLENELQIALKEKLPSDDLAELIAATCPQVKTLNIALGEKIWVNGQKEPIQCLMVTIMSSESLLEEAAIEKIKLIITAKLDIPNITLFINNEIAEVEPEELVAEENTEASEEENEIIAEIEQ